MKYVFSKHKTNYEWYITVFKDENSEGLITDSNTKISYPIQNSYHVWINLCNKLYDEFIYDSLEELTEKHFVDLL